MSHVGHNFNVNRHIQTHTTEKRSVIMDGYRVSANEQCIIWLCRSRLVVSVASVLSKSRLLTYTTFVYAILMYDD